MFTLVVADSQGNTAQDQVTLTLGETEESDTEPPTVSWVKPVGTGESYPAASGTIDLEVAASDSSGIRIVEFLRWGGPIQQEVEIGTDSSPPYQASLEVNTLNIGENGILAVAVDTAGNRGTESIFIYRLNPTITLDPTEGPPETEVTATGSGWPAGHAVSVQWEDGTELATPTVDGNGNLVVSFVVPDAAEGEYTIEFVGAPPDGGAYTIPAIFTVTAPEAQPTITLDPTEGPPGIEVTATGSRWSAGHEVSVYEDGRELAATTVDDNGDFTVFFTVPDDAAEGEYTIDFVGFPPEGGAYTIPATFTVTTSGAPSFGPAGSFIPFGCNDGRLCVMHSQPRQEGMRIPTIKYHVYLSRITKGSVDLADKEREYDNRKPGQEPMLMSKMQEALTGGFRKAERATVQLLHLSKLSELIDAIGSVVGGRVNLPAELIHGE
ncbi:MAG TPA: Ig-like domain-containing protein [Dehalococcoidia bacterium]|nr:Ig-like domain-containing protein [Dehalococcoidia bacterium]